MYDETKIGLSGTVDHSHGMGVLLVVIFDR